MVQPKRGMMGVRDILSPYHMYINVFASYASTLYLQMCGLVRHSNSGLYRMNSRGELGAIKQM